MHKMYTAVFSFLLLSFICSVQITAQTVTVPEVSGAPLMTDGYFSPGEWNGTKKIALENNVELYFMQRSGHVFIGVKMPRPKLYYIDMFLQTGSNDIFNLHASAQIGERILTGLANWDDRTPVTYWGNQRDWTANELNHGGEQDEYFPYDGIEFQIRRSRFTGDTWRARIEIKNFIGGTENIIFPAGSSRRESSGWATIILK